MLISGNYHYLSFNWLTGAMWALRMQAQIYNMCTVLAQLRLVNYIFAGLKLDLQIFIFIFQVPQRKSGRVNDRITSKKFFTRLFVQYSRHT